MKHIIFVLSFFIIACGNSKELKKPKGIMKTIYDSQKRYYNTNLAQNPDFSGLLSFSGGRSILYKNNNITIDEMDSCIILEGFNPGWSKYIGFLITKSQNWFYTKSDTSEWLFKKIDVSSSSFEKETGVPAIVIQTIIGWDTTYINNLKIQVGNIVHDGYSFWGTKVKHIKGKPLIFNYSFYQYPVR